jgi:hypothetical protein
MRALAAGAAGLAACVVLGLLPDTRAELFRGWLVAFCLVVGLALGSLVVLMLQYLTGGAWGFVLRRPLEAATRTLPLLALLYVPVAVGLPYLYEWADPAAVAADKDLQAKATYLNVPFAIGRAAAYFVIWNVLQVLFSRWSKQEDQTLDTRIADRCATLAPPGLILYVITVTFASIDWVMSLEPHWYSTIYGALFGMGQVLSGFAFAIAVFLLLAGRPPLQQVATRPVLRDLGSLLLAFVMVWAYLGFDQFLLIWAGNLPEEVPWYVSRITGPWRYVALALVLFMFALPFVWLLSAENKRNRGTLMGVALLIVGMRVFEMLWLVVPAFNHGRPAAEQAPSALSVLAYAAALLGVGGVWLGVYLWQIRQMPLLPLLMPEGEANHGDASHH